MARVIDRLDAMSVRALNKIGRYNDGGGLYLQVGPTGTKSWLFKFTSPTRRSSERDDGKVRQMGLGSLHTVGLAEARTLAADARKLVNAGVDPIDARHEQKRKARAEKAKHITFRQLAEQYIESRRDVWKHGKHGTQWSQSLETYAYPIIGDLHPADIDRGLVLKILEPIWKTKTETAARLRGRIANILDAAKVREFRSGDNPAAWKGVLDKLLPSPRSLKKVRHMPALPFAEVGTFVSELRKRDGISPKALEFTILTAARTAETIGARWSEIDFEEKIWTVPAERMKAKRPHRVPLSGRALDILKSLPREADNPHVFIGTTKGAAISNMAMLSLMKDTRPDLTVHGFRSTFRDWCSETTSYAHDVVEMALAHVIEGRTERAYRRDDMLPKRRRLMNDWARYCDVVIPAKTENVTPIRPRSGNAQ